MYLAVSAKLHLATNKRYNYLRLVLKEESYCKQNVDSYGGHLLLAATKTICVVVRPPDAQHV